MYYLWLNGKKASSLDDICSNYDAGAICGYFYSGSLAKWLCEIGAEKVAQQLVSVDKEADIDEQLAVIFGQKPPAPFVTSEISDNNFIAAEALFNRNAAASAQNCSFFAGSRLLNDISNGSSSFLSESFFGTAYSFSSFELSSFLNYLSGSFAGFSSFLFTDDGKSVHERIMINLSSEPLNRFGYGIHLI